MSLLSSPGQCWLITLPPAIISLYYTVPLIMAMCSNSVHSEYKQKSPVIPHMPLAIPHLSVTPQSFPHIPHPLSHFTMNAICLSLPNARTVLRKVAYALHVTTPRAPSALSVSSAPCQFVINTSSFRKSSRFWFATGILLLLLFNVTLNVGLKTLSLLGNVINGHAPTPPLRWWLSYELHLQTRIF